MIYLYFTGIKIDTGLFFSKIPELISFYIFDFFIKYLFIFGFGLLVEPFFVSSFWSLPDFYFFF